MSPTARRLAALVALVTLAQWFGSAARAQLPESEERLKILTDPESVKKKAEKDKTRPPLEIFRSQVAPFDVLPFVKANHWSTLTLEARANYDDFAGALQTSPVPMLGLPQEIVYGREARLAKTQVARLGMQVMLPKVPRELGLELIHPEAIRASAEWPAPLRELEPHQMLIVLLTKESSDPYAPWMRFQAMFPNWVERNDPQALDKMRYYRLVLPIEPEKPPLSPHPLTWSTTSHVIWDGMAPDVLNPSQQQAMLDWLHWGGQLVLVGGPGPSFSLLKDSFLSPYLPADPTGENEMLGQKELAPLSAAYPPPFHRAARDLEEEMNSPYDPAEGTRSIDSRYRSSVSIRPPTNRPVFFGGLKPRPGAVALPLDESGKVLLGVEQRVGRGRILMQAFSLTDPAVAAWPGLDTFVRRVVLRRPEESRASRLAWDGVSFQPGRFSPLPGPDLTWVRYLSRDMGAPLPRAEPLGGARARVETKKKKAEDEDAPLDEAQEYQPPDAAVGEWLDTAALPHLCRDALEEASGIKVPGSSFVLKVVLAYVLILVPLNWLVCRYLLGRRELAWVVVPLLALGFAVGVERAAAYDIGYNTACDEIDVLEVYADYPRGHLARFSSLFTTGRTRYTVAFPDNPTALVLPLDNGRSLRGEDVATSSFRSFPVPALEGFLVQPRSLSMVRAEEMVTLDGSVSLVTEGGVRRVVNQTGATFRDAVVVDLAGPKERRETYLGTIGPGAAVEVKAVPRPNPERTEADALRPHRFLREFRQVFEDRPENMGEIRLVAWSPRPMPGQKVEPAVDRHRGFTAYVVHLRNGPPPSPDGPVYNDAGRARGAGPSAVPGGTPTRKVVPTPPLLPRARRVPRPVPGMSP